MPFIHRCQMDTHVLAYHSAADWSQMLCSLLSAILVGANYNRYVAEVGASMMNLAQTLADAEREIKLNILHTAKLSRPWAIGLTAGNEEEWDNVFIEYISHRIRTFRNMLTQEDFNNNRNGQFYAQLFDQKEKGKHIPRPTKSCRPDWVLRYRGIPLAYSEAKSSGLDTQEGLSYTTILTSNILNFAPPTTPAIVVHLNDEHFHFQVVYLDLEHRALKVLHRTRKKYYMHPKGGCQRPGYDMLTRQQKKRVEALDNIPIPTHYHYEKVHKSTVQDINTFKKNVYDHYIQGLPKEHVSLDDSYLLSHLHKCNDLPSHLLMINKYPVQAQFTVIWAQLDLHLCEFAVAIFEGIDILVSSLLLQDPKNASIMYDMA